MALGRGSHIYVIFVISREVDEGSSVDVVSMDMARAFGRIPQKG